VSVFQHFQERAWIARDMGYPKNHRPLTPQIIAQDRTSLIKEAHQWRILEKYVTERAHIYRRARYDALLSAYSLRGVGHGC
jgi:hypothetical protein